MEVESIIEGTWAGEEEGVAAGVEGGGGDGQGRDVYCEHVRICVSVDLQMLLSIVCTTHQ